MTINPLAEELNRQIREENEAPFELLSELGKQMYFPRGIVDQSSEARQKAHRFNATIGIATRGGQAMFLPSLFSNIGELSPDQAFAYPPTTGVPALRERWLAHLREANPSLGDKPISLPVVTGGITHGLALVSDMFCEQGDPVIIPDLMWGNYKMIFGLRRKGELKTYPFFDAHGGLNLKGLRSLLKGLPECKKAILLLNFPHNPTGYTPTLEESQELLDIIQGQADGGRNILAVTDDAYFGFFYEERILRESLFGLLCDLHPRVLAVKLDGATKEDYAWGFRIGFITLGIRGAGQGGGLYAAFERKFGGAIRSSISCCSSLSQNLLLRSMDSPTYRTEKEEGYAVLRERYEKVRDILSGGNYEEAFTAYPFNSGYFMCIRLKGVNAEELRQRLLKEEGVGVISLGGEDVRIAFSCIEADEVQTLFDILYNAVMKTRQEKQL